MKVFYVSNLSDGCQAVRCLHPLTYNGWDGDKMSLAGQRMSLQDAAYCARQADIVVFQRPDDEERLRAALILKKLGKKIVFDNDDTYKHITDYMNLKEYLSSKTEILDRFIKLADLVTTTTDFLAKEYRELNDNVVVLPNCVDPSDYTKPLRNETDKVRIGIFGSVAVNGDFFPIQDALKKLVNDTNITLVLFGLMPKDKQSKELKKIYGKELKFWNSLNIEWQQHVPLKDYYYTLNKLRLDMALIPRQDNYFNRCKSNLKFLEASMLEIPVIAQGFSDGLSPYQGKEDSKNMFIVEDNSKWLETIKLLAGDKQMRQEMGQKAREYVLNNYDIKKNAHKWANAYKQCLSQTTK